MGGIAMEAGRELDALIAEKVMGWSYKPYYNGGGEWVKDGRKVAFGGFDGGSLPRYSTDIAAAWLVVEKMGNWHGFDFLVQMLQPRGSNTYEAGWYEQDYDGFQPRATGDADTVPLAICLAALKTID